MNPRHLLGWILAALWLGGVQYYIYCYDSMAVFWIVLLAWVAIGIFTFRNLRRSRAAK